MKESLWGYWLIILGIFILSVMLLLQNYTTTNEQDVYLIKEITDAAMGDSLDLAHYRKYGEIRIIKEKFVENFTRRFTETSTFGQGNYSVEFYEISESPAKVSLRIMDLTNSYNIYNSFNGGVATEATQVQIINEITAILDGYK